jgi:imidazolonepropionase
MILENAHLATLTGEAGYGLIPDGALVIDGSRIVWVGPRPELPDTHAAAARTDLGGRLVTPGLIDCHTHLVHGGHRAREFEMRLEGATYEDIARAGGGILSTVEATRAAGEDALLAAALPRVDALLADGVTTVEIKSGYGLDQGTELAMLRVARRIARERRVRVVTSFLGAHAVPPGYKGRAGAYLDEVCLPALRAAAEEGLVDAVDGFCEGIAFDTDQIARVFDLAAELGLPTKLHAEQLSHSGGTALAAARGSLSADHLEYATADDARAMASAGTVAVLLPGAFYTLRERQAPPVGAFREAGVPMAVATDLNPGSSPLHSLTLAMNMACTLFRLTPEEALRGTTRNAARALGMTGSGVLAPGAVADLAVWDLSHPAELSYRIGDRPLYARYVGGRP